MTVGQNQDDSSAGNDSDDSSVQQAPAIELQGVWKVFGRHAAEAVERIRAGESREEVRKTTGTTAAVVDASIQVQEGEIFVVMGLSGSGKSTLVRMINRLFEPTAGRVLVQGEDITEAPAQDLRRVRSETISMVFQHFALFPHRTVLENAGYGLEARGVGRDERTERGREALGMVGLERWGDSLPNELSGGMRQRVGLARALATDAPILLMDEAFSALDPLIKREMQDQLIELQERLQRSIVFITHDLNEAMRLGDRIAVLREGDIVQTGTSEQILQEPANDYVAEFVRDVDRSRVLTAEAAMVEPVARIAAREGAAAAMARMQELQVSALFVLGPDRKLVGAVHDRDVAEVLRRRDHSLEDVVEHDIPTTSRDTLLSDLFETSLETPLPLAVVDEDQRLLGVLPRVSLIAALAGMEPDPSREQMLPSPASTDGAGDTDDGGSMVPTPEAETDV